MHLFALLSGKRQQNKATTMIINNKIIDENIMKPKAVTERPPLSGGPDIETTLDGEASLLFESTPTTR